MSNGIELHRYLVVAGGEEVDQSSFQPFINLFLLWWFTGVDLHQSSVNDVLLVDQFLKKHPKSWMCALEDRVDTSMIGFGTIVRSHR